jgi:hypothetical protein
VSLAGEQVRIPDPTAIIHLQFRRFAGCPICDLHLRSFVRRGRDLTAGGVREVVVFHSSTEQLRAFGAHALPFPVIADPDKRLYLEFGVESAPRALLDPRVWWTIIRAVGWRLWEAVRGEAPLRAPRAENGRLGLPADFLIASDGRVVARKYGEHASDQWSVGDVIERAMVRNGLPSSRTREDS